MDLSAYLLDGVVASTAPPNETTADAQCRRAAIIEMFEAFEPGDTMEAMMACHCIALQFLMDAAMRDGSHAHLNPAVGVRARAGAVSISKTLHQWVSKLEQTRHRKAAREAERRKVEQETAVEATAPEPVPAPPPQPTEAPTRTGMAPPRPGQPPRPEAEPFDDLIADIQAPDGRPAVWDGEVRARVAS